jgi:hypothetical protein
MTNVRTFHQCCEKVVAAVVASKPGSLMRYAAAYAQAGREMDDPEYIRVQCLYILNNLGHWRGEEAREVKATFKRLATKKAWEEKIFTGMKNSS